MGQAAERFGIPERTIRQWCETGKLAAIPKAYGRKTTYQIALQAIEFLMASLHQEQEWKRKAKAESVDYPKAIQAWKSAMLKGGMTGKPFSPLTVDYYVKNIEALIGNHKAFNLKAVQTEFSRTHRDEFARRYKLYKAVVSFGKFLIRRGALDECFLQEIKPLQPKRHKPPKRVSVNEIDLQALLDKCGSVQERLIVYLLASTGIRASEACAVRLQDINLEEGRLNIPVAKGGKTRKLGMTGTLSALIGECLADRQRCHSAMALLIGEEGKPMDRWALYRLLKRLGKSAGVTVHPHALRRAFVTINANKGRPLVILQRSCGHSDIKTTMGYCMTTEQEVIEAMKDWE